MLTSLLSLTVLLVSTVSNVYCSSVGPGGRRASRRAAASSSAGLYSYRAPQRGGNEVREAVVFSDGKLDDKMAIHFLKQEPGYNQMHIMINGVRDQSLIHGSLLDFEQQMHDAAVAHVNPFHTVPTVYYSGRNPLRKAAPHEAVSVGRSEPLENRQQDLNDHLLPKSQVVDIWHIGPTYHEDIEHVVDTVHDKGKKIGLLHSTIGYNSMQNPENHGNENTIRHVQSLHELLRPEWKDARVLLISSPFTFGGAVGGVHPFDKVRGTVPPDHLIAATEKEPFHLNTFKEADKLIRKQSSDRADPLPGQDSGHDADNIVQQYIWAGRKKDSVEDQEMSAHFQDLVDQRKTIIAAMSNQTLKHNTVQRRLDAVKSGFANPCEVEVCDLKHCAVSWDAYKNNQRSLVPVRPVDHRTLERDDTNSQSPCPYSVQVPRARYAEDLFQRHFPVLWPSYASQ